MALQSSSAICNTAEKDLTSCHPSFTYFYQYKVVVKQKLFENDFLVGDCCIFLKKMRKKTKKKHQCRSNSTISIFVSLLTGDQSLLLKERIRSKFFPVRVNRIFEENHTRNHISLATKHGTASIHLKSVSLTSTPAAVCLFYPCWCHIRLQHRAFSLQRTPNK